MAIRPLNSVAGFSVGETPGNIILANGDITTTNITTTGVSNLNSVSNIKISGGSAGQIISTDGAGNLSFVTVGSGSISNGTSNVLVLNSGNITFSVGGTANVGVITTTGINISGTLNTGTGNATVGNLDTTQVFATANVTAPQFISNVANGTAPFLITSTTIVANLNADQIDGFDTAVTATANTVAVRDTNGNISGNFFIGNGSQLTGLTATRISNGTSNVELSTINGNVTIGVSGNANILVVTGTGANITGTLGVSSNANVGNLGTAQVLATANVTAPQLISNIATGTAPFVVTSTTQVANLSVATAGTATSATAATNAAALLQNTSTATTVYPTFSTSSANGNSQAVINTSISANLGNASITATTFVGALSGAATTAGTVTTAAQPNITSVGTLTSLSVTGNVTGGNISATNGNLTTANISGNVILGNTSVTTAISWASATTTSITANQTIASFSVSSVTGIEFLVKGTDAAGSKYSVSKVIAVSNGTSVDYSTFGTVNLGGFTGSLAVNIVGGFVRLQVTPASSNSTVWTTQYRFV